MMQRALIIGSGVAGLTCARLLALRGWEVEIWGNVSPFSPTLVLNDTTQFLLQDIWELENSFWQDFHVLNERKVCWGVDADVLDIAEASVVIKGNVLAERIKERLLLHPNLVFVERSPDETRLTENFTWVIDAGGRKGAIALSLGGGKRYTFGQRCILSQEVMLTKESEQNACWIETVPDGWMFLAPLGEGKALLQCMVTTVLESPALMLTRLLEKTRFLKFFVSKFLDITSVFEAYPQILAPLCGLKWIAVGDAAISFDPISGDGTGYAIRGAILAASVIDAISSQGLNSSECLHHYTQRLHKTFFSHLKECFNYYSLGFSSSAWESEIKLMLSLGESSIYDSASTDSFAYKLDKFNLIPINN